MSKKRRESQFLVDMKVKENKGKFTPKVDSFRGTAEDARDLLDIKYCKHKGALFNFARFYQVASQEIEQFARELEEKFGVTKEEMEKKKWKRRNNKGVS